MIVKIAMNNCNLNAIKLIVLTVNVTRNLSNTDGGPPPRSTRALVITAALHHPT